MFKALWSAVIGGNPMSWVVMGLAFVIYTGAIFGGGFYEGDTHQSKIVAAAAMSAAGAAQSAQAVKDNKDYNAGYEDGIALAAKNAVAAPAAEALKTKAAHELPRPSKTCPAQTLAPDLVKGLNDPAIIGDTP